MSPHLQILLLAVYVVLDALLQGHHTLLFRRWVPVHEQRSINLNLHFVAPLLYALFTGAVCRDWWPGYGYALGLRLALFDPLLNLAKGDALFVVGFSAAGDRLTRTVAGWLRLSEVTLSLVGRAVVLVLLAAALLLLTSCRTEKLVTELNYAPAALPATATGVPDSLAARPGLLATVKQAFSGKKAVYKDKRRITVYNAPAKVTGGSTAIVGEHNTAATTGKAKAPTATGTGVSATGKAKAPVATGSDVSATDNHKGQGIASGPNSTAGLVPEASGPAWWVYGLLVLLGLLVGVAGALYWLLRKLTPQR